MSSFCTDTINEMDLWKFARTCMCKYTICLVAMVICFLCWGMGFILFVSRNTRALVVCALFSLYIRFQSWHYVVCNLNQIP